MPTLPLVLPQYSVDLLETLCSTPHILCLLLLSLLLLLKTLTIASKYNLPPSPPKLPLLGNFHQIGSLPYRSLRALSDRYGPVMLIHEGKVPTLVVSSPEVAREVLKTQDVKFSNKYVTRGAGVIFYEGHDVLISPYGQRWMELRKLCVAELLTQKRVLTFQDIRKEVLAHVVANIQQSCLKKEPVNLSVMSTTAANNIACRCILGQNFEGVGGPGFGRLAKKVTKLFVSFSFRELFPYMGWMDRITGFDAKLEKIFKLVDGFLDRVIKEHKCTMNDNENKGFIDALLNLKKASVDGGDITPKTVKGVLLDVLMGGINTSGLTIVWTMSELVRNPTIMSKAQEEVRRVVGKKAPIDLDDVAQMEYLTCVIKETLRLHPPGPFLVARETSTWIKLKGYDIPPKTKVLINVWAIHRDPKLWEMSEEFYPERFLDNSIDFNGQNFQFLPFGSGRRGCPGISFGIASISYILANFLHWFDWDLPEGMAKDELDMTERYGLAIHKKYPLFLVPTPYNP